MEITVSQNFVVDDNLINLLKEVVQVTSTENDKIWEERRKMSYKEGFSKGVIAAMEYCNPQICDGTNLV